MNKLCLLIIFGLCGVVGVSGQVNLDNCPADKVCISREAAVRLLAADDRAKALEAELVVLKQAVEDHKKIETDLKIELAKAIGEKTGLEKNAVSDRAIIDLLLRSVKKKCLPLSVCF